MFESFEGLISLPLRLTFYFPRQVDPNRQDPPVPLPAIIGSSRPLYHRLDSPYLRFPLALTTLSQVSGACHLDLDMRLGCCPVDGN